MPEITHGFSISDALARNEDVYEVEFERWGTRLQAPGFQAPEVNLQWPPPGSRPIPTSLAAVSIGPRSTIDRCWMTWNRQKRLDIVPADNTDPNAVVSLPRIITCDAPLLFPQASTAGPTLDPTRQSWWDAMQNGTAYVFPWGPKPGFNNLTQGMGSNGHGGQFGTTTGYFSGENFVTYTGQVLQFTPSEDPFLQLILYTKLPTFSPPTKRAPMLREGLWQIGNTNPLIAAIYPIFGRKHVNISLISHNFSGVPAKTVDYTIGLIRNVNEDPTGSQTPIFEVKAAEALAVPANTGVNIPLNNPCADYVVIHVGTAALNVPAGGAFTVVAED